MRPVLIDLNDGPCEMCAAHKQGICDHCGKKIDPRDPNMGVNGYQSVKASHFHLRPVEGLPGREGRHAELCYECHRADRLAVYGEGYGEEVAA
jgi:hypothetical protein